MPSIARSGVNPWGPYVRDNIKYIFYRLRNQYLNVLRRRPFRDNKRAKLDGGQTQATALFKQFTACMCDIQELAALMSKVRSCMPESFDSPPPPF
jgi:hypothetical protein